MPKKKQACCSVCGRYRNLTAAGVLAIHKPHGVLCDGSLQPPRAPKRQPGGWPTARKAALERDKHTCQKCGSRSGLEVHHKKERVHGGGDELPNLITLCSNCHCEWTFCQPPEAVSFDQWLGIPPARFLVVLFAQPWPTDKTAEAFRSETLLAMSLVAAQRSKD